jgi:hypothetical protein
MAIVAFVYVAFIASDRARASMIVPVDTVVPRIDDVVADMLLQLTPTVTSVPVLDTLHMYDSLPTITPIVLEIPVYKQDWDKQAWLSAIRVPGYADLGYYYDGIAVGEPIRVKLSYYWPPLCITESDSRYQINCGKTDNGLPEPRYLASGQDWVSQQLAGKVVACPIEYPLGTRFVLDGRMYVCRDRGSEIVRVDDATIWLDVLYPEPLPGRYYGQVIDGLVLPPL